MVIFIKGIKFKVVLLNKHEYQKKHTPSNYAHFDKESRELVFREDYIKKNIIIHEVTHAFIGSLHLGSCHDISIEDFEEIICEMMEDHILDINRISNEILRFLKEQTKPKRRKK